MNSFDSFDLFSVFSSVESQTPAEEKKEVVIETKAPVTAPTDNVDINLEDEADDIEASDSDVEEKADTAKAAKRTTKKDKKVLLTGPVTVKGIGWTFTYGDFGVQYEPKIIVKAAFDAGYKEIALLRRTHDGGSTIFCSFDTVTPSNEDIQMGAECTVMLGNNRATYRTEDFDGLMAEEISLFDLALKYVETHPDFKGCSLKFDSRIKAAVPVFDKTVKLKDNETYTVYSDGGNQQLTGEQIGSLYPSSATVTAYCSDSNVIFLSAKQKEVVTCSTDELGITGTDSKQTIKELYHLPFQIWIENFGIRQNCTDVDFGGKEVVTKEDVVALLSKEHKIFKSKRKIDILYNRNAKVVGVAVISGEKGAVAAPYNIVSFPVINTTNVRVENTELGVFRGLEHSLTGLITNVTFESKLPKIPVSILAEVVKEFQKDLSNENMVQIYWSIADECYYIKKPSARYSKIRVVYEMTHSNDILAMTIHSHNTMVGRFSAIDDADEIYTGLFGVIGNLDRRQLSMEFRAGMEGSFTTLDVSELFSYDGNGGVCA